MQPDDDLSTPSARVRARRLDRRVVLTRRAVVGGGIALLGGGIAALVAAALPGDPPTPVAESGAPSASAPPAATPTETSETTAPTATTSGSRSPAAEPPGATTIAAVWAHPDNDIIFSNPGLSDAIAAGATVRTVFVTAGDAGRGTAYMKERELGILKAYNRMRGRSGTWTPRQITLDTGARVTRFVADDDARLSLTMLRLPDGGLDAGGFAATGNAGLTQLLDGRTTALATLDGSPAYDVAQLTATLAELVGAAQPTQVSTHIPRGSAFADGDHPDHSCVGALTRIAAPQAGIATAAVSYFLGYPSQKQPVNVDGGRLHDKVDTYRTYAQEDPVVRCADEHACLAQRGFGDWLQRTYAKGESDLQMR